MTRFTTEIHQRRTEARNFWDYFENFGPFFYLILASPHLKLTLLKHLVVSSLKISRCISLSDCSGWLYMKNFLDTFFVIFFFFSIRRFCQCFEQADFVKEGDFLIHNRNVILVHTGKLRHLTSLHDQHLLGWLYTGKFSMTSLHLTTRPCKQRFLRSSQLRGSI